ncbi:hypothetical protein BH11PLA2_BH11PLA2_45480 [soil metagenome]
MSDTVPSPGIVLDRLRRVRHLSRDLPLEPDLGTATYGPPQPATASFPNAAPATESFFLGLDESPDPGLDTTPHERRTAPSQTMPASRMVGPYQVQTVLGRGGMGIVFKAHDTRLNRTVALKMLLGGAATDERIARRFTTEAQALARLDHPNVVPVYDVNDWDGLPYFVMKHVQGGTLAHAAERLRADPKAAVKVFVKVCKAVGYLHSQQVSHRDLKPLNILLTDGDEPLVADFGLAKLHDSDPGLTVTNCLLGTRYYMAPEQTRGSQASLTSSCDIWSLGVILYELLSGKLPFEAENFDELFERIRDEVPADLVLADGTVDLQLNAVVQRALAKDPAERYPTATALGEDLERWLAGQTVEAPIPPPPTAPRRKRTGWYAAIAVAMLAGGILAAVIFSSSPERAVVLIGETGNPLVTVDPIAESKPQTGLDARNRYTLQAKDAGFLDLGSYRYPGGMRIEATVQQLECLGHYSYAGVYFRGAMDQTGPKGQRLICATVRVDTIENEIVDDKFSLKTGFGSLDVGRWDPNEKTPWSPKQIGGLVSLSRSRMKPNITAPLQKLRIDLKPDGSIVSAVNDNPIAPATFEALNKNYDLATWHDKLPSPPPVSRFGDHVGLTVESCKAAFWNVSVRPLQP